MQRTLSVNATWEFTNVVFAETTAPVSTRPSANARLASLWITNLVIQSSPIWTRYYIRPIETPSRASFVVSVVKTLETNDRFITATLCISYKYPFSAWWHHQMKTFSALLALREGNPPVTGGFPSQRPVTRLFDVFFDLRLNKRLSKQYRCQWFGTPFLLSWRHWNMWLTIYAGINISYSYDLIVGEFSIWLMSLYWQGIKPFPVLTNTCFVQTISGQIAFHTRRKDKKSIKLNCW